MVDSKADELIHNEARSAALEAPTTPDRWTHAPNGWFCDYDDAMAKADNKLAGALDKIEKDYADVIARARLYFSPNQVVNFCECVETRKSTISPAEVGGRSCTLCLLCNMSYQYDTGFDWDPVAMTFANGTGKGISLKREGDCNGWEVVV